MYAGIKRLPACRAYLFWLGVFLIAPATASTAAVEGRLSVYVVNYPLKYFAERIGAGHIAVEFPAPSGVDPAFWTPGAETILAYQRADIVLLNGASYAKWIAMATLPRTRLVDTSREFSSEFLSAEDVTHSHGTTGEHAHGNFAFTTWLDLTQSVAQAEAITEALSRKRPQLRSEFERNFEALKDELLALDAELESMARQAPGRPLLASHPIYQYLARRYALNIESLHWEPDQVPNETEWSRLKEVLGKHPAKWMIWEQAPNESSVQRLRAMGIESLVFTPASNPAKTADFMTIMRANVAHLRRALD